MLYDTHAHLNDVKFSSDYTDVLHAVENADSHVNIVGYDCDSSRSAVSIAKVSPSAHAVVGIHPDACLESIDDIASLVLDECVVGIGECGFDWYRVERTEHNFSLQESLFRSQIELALRHDMPLMVHTRSSKGSHDAYEDVLSVFDSYSNEEALRAQVHFFVGDVDITNEMLKRPYLRFSFTGVVTFGHEYDDVIRMIPLDRIMVETDAPYVAPVPFRGQRAEPLHVEYVLCKIADVKGLGYEEVKKQVFDSSVEWFLNRR